MCKTRYNILIALLLLSSVVEAQQVVDFSYVKSRSYISTNGTDVIEHMDYDNGLGGEFLQVDVGASPTNKNIATYMEYDDQRRLSKRWLPVAVTSKEVMGVLGLNSLSSDCYHDAYPFVENFYEASPNGGKTQSYQPGSDMRSGEHHDKYSIMASVKGNDSLDCKNLRAYGDGLCEIEDYSNTPFKVVRHEDAEGNSVYEFYDSNERMVLSRLLSGTTILSTYYVYDCFGNLTFVIPPSVSQNITSYTDTEGAASTDTFKKLVTVYKYDGFHRCIYKRIPGCEPIYYIYDKVGNLVFSQDGNQRERGEWSYSIPDRFGREALKGTCKNEFDYQSNPLQNQKVWADFLNTEEYSAWLGYKIEGISLQNMQLLEGKMYDDYSYQGSIGLPSNIKYMQPPVGCGSSRSRSKGLLTGNMRCSLPKGAIFEAYYYDDMDRLVQSNSTHFDDLQHDFFGYDLTGNVLTHQYCSQMKGRSDVRQVYTYAYDHAGRLLKAKHQLNDGPVVTLAENSYDELGRLCATVRNGNGQLATSYAYNVRSQLTHLSTSGLFDEKLYYTEEIQGNVPRYDGNITGMEWTAGGKSRGYNFEYDGFSRLKRANYLENGARSKHYDTYYSYSYGGNINHLTRRGLQDGGSYGLIDNLICFYDGYKLKRVFDYASDPTYHDAFNFVKGGKGSIEYEYDKNGNLVKDLNKKVCKIEYNILNLPTTITFEDGNTISYIYDMDGTKRKVIHKSASPSSQHVLEYRGNMVYEDNSLKQILVDGGYISFESNVPVYHFYLDDHLGNHRVVVNQNAQVEQLNHYYPYGGLMGESTDQDIQSYKYNGKELDRMFGLNWYDYGARSYDAALCQWFNPDALAGKYPSISPYAYCMNNPINAFDPDGNDSYYTTNGVYICDNLKETDNIYIVSGYKYLRQIELGKWLVQFQGKTPITKADISAEAYSNIFTDILKRLGYDTSMLMNGKISVNVLENNKSNSGPLYNLKDYANAPRNYPWSNAEVASEYKKYDGKIQITANVVLSDFERRNYLSTISNIESILGVHEFLGHGILGLTKKEHWKILDMQKNHPSWEKTTRVFKDLYDYLIKHHPDEYLFH